MGREILDFLKMNDVEYKEELSLAEISPIRIGGKVKIIAEKSKSNDKNLKKRCLRI